MPETLTQYIARMKAEKQAEKQAADFLAGKLRATPPAFRSGVTTGLQLAFPGDLGLMAERGPAEGLPFNMPGDPYGGGGE